MQQSQRLAVRGLLRLKANSLDHKLKLRQNIRREDKSVKTMMEQAKEHYIQKLKYPIRLRNDPEWHAEKIYRLKLKQYKAGRLKVEYFERANNQIYMEGRDIPMVQTQPLNEEDHDDTFDNFTRKKFVELPTSRFYDETLELSFGVGQVLKTEPSEPVNYKDFAITKQSIKHRERLPQSIQLKKNFRSFVDENTRGGTRGLQRGRSFTSALLSEIVRDRRFTKISKESDRTRLKSAIKVDQIELDFAASIAQLRVLTQAYEGPISKQLVAAKLLSRYEFPLAHLPFRCYRRDDNLHLKETIEAFNRWNWTKINKMVFEYYDFNRNGLIDEEDLLRMLQQSQSISAISKDYHTLQMYLRRFGNNIRDQPPSPSKSNASIHKRMSRLSRISMPTVTEDDSQHFKHPELEVANSKLPKFWTLTEEKEGAKPSQKTRQEKKQISPQESEKPAKQICISLSRFQEIFRLERPELYYDIMSFLFGYVRPDPSKSPLRRRSYLQRRTNVTAAAPTEISQHTVETIKRKLQEFKKQSNCYTVVR